MNYYPQNNRKRPLYIPLAEAASYVPYSQDYLSLLARKGKLHAKKIGRNWHTTVEAVLEYHKNQKQFVSDNISDFVSDQTPQLADYIPSQQPETYNTESQKQNLEQRANVNQSVPPFKKPRFKKIRKLFFSTPNASARFVFADVVVFVIFGGVKISFADELVAGIKNFFKDATSLQGKFPGTHGNEFLVLNNSGDIDIYGHIVTHGQLQSLAPDGVAPIVVNSSTTVPNLSSQYLDGISKGAITLSFVTANGNTTNRLVNLNGGLNTTDATINGSLTSNGQATLNGPLLVRGLSIFNNTLTSNAPANFKNTLDVLCKTTLNEVDFKGDLNVQGLTTLNNTNINGNLSVFGPGIFNSTLWAGALQSPSGSFGTTYTNTIRSDNFYFGYENTTVDLGSIYTKNWSISAGGTAVFPIANITTLQGSPTFQGNITLDSPYGITLNAGNITGNQLSAPTGLSTQTATGGSLAADTYYYIITALNANGETIGSSEASQVIDGVTETAVTLTWNELTGATSYRIYGRATGAQDAYFTVTESLDDDDDSTVTSTDTGTAGTAGTVPTSNSTGGSATFAGTITANGVLTSTGVIDFGSATSFEIPSSATPVVDGTGEVALDTTITGHTGLIKYYDGTEELTIIGVPTHNLTATDGRLLSYNATNDEFEFIDRLSGAQYVVLSADATLTDERVLAGTANQIVVTDGGAGASVTLSLPQDIAATSAVTFATLDTGQGANEL